MQISANSHNKGELYNLSVQNLILYIIRKKSIFKRLKIKLFGKEKIANDNAQQLKASSEETDVDVDDTSFSRSSSGIGTMSTKSKTIPECDDDESQMSQSNKDVSDCSLDSSQTPKTTSKENVIPVIPRHNFGVFSRRLIGDTSRERSSGKSCRAGRNILTKMQNKDADT